MRLAGVSLGLLAVLAAGVRLAGTARTARARRRSRVDDRRGLRLSRVAGVTRAVGVAGSRLRLAGVSLGLVAVLIATVARLARLTRLATTRLRRRSRVDHGSSLSRGNGVSVRRAGGRNGVSVRGCAGRGNGVGVA